MPYKSVLSSSHRRKKSSSSRKSTTSTGSSTRTSTPPPPPVPLPSTTYVPPPPPPPKTHYPLQPHPPRLYFPLHEAPTNTPPSFHLPTPLFLLSGSLAIFEPATSRVVLIHDTLLNRWHLPRGRKDRGESISTCALREGAEESGYVSTLLKYSGETIQPRSDSDRLNNVEKHSEAFWIHGIRAHRWLREKRRVMKVVDGVEVEGEEEWVVIGDSPATFIYQTMYFLAVMEPGQTPAPKLVGKHESGYVSHLMDVDEAVVKLASQPFGKVGEAMVFVPPLGVEGDAGDREERWQKMVEEGLKGGWVKPAKGGDGYLISADIARKLHFERLDGGVAGGGLYPDPIDASDDGAVQAMVVKQGWEVVKRELGLSAERKPPTTDGFAVGVEASLQSESSKAPVDVDVDATTPPPASS